VGVRAHVTGRASLQREAVAVVHGRALVHVCVVRACPNDAPSTPQRRRLAHKAIAAVRSSATPREACGCR
jgi:hypothetical protein